MSIVFFKIIKIKNKTRFKPKINRFVPRQKNKIIIVPPDKSTILTPKKNKNSVRKPAYIMLY